MMENRLQERRLELGMTQPQVSERLRATEPRCDVGMVSRYEKGVCLPTKEQLSSLEVLYGIPMTEIYRMEDLDLLGLLPAPQEATAESEKVVRVEPPSHLGRVRKCYRISQAFASSLPDDLLQVCVLLLAELARRRPEAAFGRICGPEAGRSSEEWR